MFLNTVELSIKLLIIPYQVTQELFEGFFLFNV